jgi:hypothetical protein
MRYATRYIFLIIVVIFIGAAANALAADHSEHASTAAPLAAPDTTVQEMSSLIHDLSGRMLRVSDEMSGGSVGAERQKELAVQMKDMSSMMQKVFGLLSSSHKGVATQKHMQEMHHGLEKMK